MRARGGALGAAARARGAAFRAACRPLFAAGLMAPGWAVGVFIAVWLVLFGLACVWVRRKPLWVVPLPFVAAARLAEGVPEADELMKMVGN